MSHGHSHGGGDGGHGHSHGGKQVEQQRVPTNFLQACTAGAMGVVIAFFEPDAVNLVDDGGCTALHWAALNGHAHVVRFLLDNGCPINVVEAQSQTALHFAASQNHCEIVHILLDHGFDPMIRDSNNNTAHGSAANNDALAALHILWTRAPVDPNHADAQGNTLLAWGAYRGKLNVVRACHEMWGVPIETYGKYNRNPLHWAAREGHADVCVYLMGAGNLDPNRPDSEGKSPLQWAEERFHYETATAIRENWKQWPDRNVNTLRALLSNHNGVKWHLFRLAVMLAYFVLCFILLRFVPPVVLFTMMTGWMMKNTFLSSHRKTGILNHREIGWNEQLVGQLPKTFQECMCGPPWLFGREPAAVFAFPIVIGIQLFIQSGGTFSFGGGGVGEHELVGSDGKKASSGHHFDGATIPMMALWALFAAKIFGSLVKFLGSRDIMQSNPSIKDFPYWDAIDRRNWEDVKAGDAIFDPIALIRKPARAFFCNQLGVVIKRFDSWTTIVDCPLSHSNMRFYFFLIVSLFVAEFLLMKAAWDNAMIRNGCLITNADGSHSWAHQLKNENGGGEHSATQHHIFNWCNVFFSLLVQASPCPAPHSWLGGAPLHKLSWTDLFVSDHTTRADTICILMPLVFLITLGVNIVTMLQNAASASSYEESKEKKVPCTEGGLISLKRAHGFGSVFGEGSALANVFLFLIGKDGVRFDGVMSVPSHQKPQHNPHPLVVPNKKHSKGHDH